MQKLSNLFYSCFLLWLIFATSATSLAQAQSAPGTKYTITMIGRLDGRITNTGMGSSGYGISPDGKITGRSDIGSGTNATTHAFIYQNGVKTDLGELGDYAAVGSIGYGINANGQVAGSSYVRASSPVRHAFLYSDGYMRDLGSLGNTESYGYGINANGDVTGITSVNIGGNIGLHAFTYRNGKIIDIGTLTGYKGTSTGYAINDSGQVTGSSTITVDGPGPSRAFLYSSGMMTDLGTLGGSNSVGYGINANGQVTGASDIAGDGAQHAFLHNGSTMTDIGTLNGYFRSEGRSINSGRDVVGIATSVAGVTRPFLYRGGVMTDLNDFLPVRGQSGVGWTLLEATGINDAGQIVGTGYYYGPEYNGRTAFLMSPIGGVNLSASSLSLIKGGAAGSYTLALMNPPTADVVVTVSPGTQLTASPVQLTFTPANWNVPQIVTVQAIQNNIAEGPHTATLTHTAVSTDQRYNGIAISNVGVTITDAVIPIATIPVTPGAVWTQSGLPVTGTAAPAAIVMVTATNPTTGAVSAVSAAATANGAWSLTLTGLTDGNYELQPEASGLKGNKLTFTVDITGSLRPVLLPPVPDGGVWTQANMPLRGTAPPGSAVILHILGLHNGVTSTRTTVAAEDGTWSILLPGLEDGHYQLQAEVNGLFSNLFIVNVDSHAPMTTLSVRLGSGGSGGGASVGGWNTGPLTIGLSAVDGAAGQGVDHIEYRLDDGAWIVFPGAGLTLDHDGIYNFCYRSLDLAANVEQAHCVPLWIDATAPTVTPSFDAARNILNLNATDAVSGIDSLEISLDGGITWTSSTGTVSFPRDGRYTVLYRCRDKAGNVTTGQSTVTVVTLPSLSLPPDQSATEGRAQSFTLGLFADQRSDSPWRLDIDWGDGSSRDAQTLAAPGSLGGRMHTYADNGIYTVTLKITDAAGNTGSKSFRIAVANAAPTADLVAGGPINEGGTASVALRNPNDLSGIDIQAGFHYAFACNDAALTGATYANSSASAAAACTYADGPGTHTVRARIIDKDDGFTEYMANILINNVAPSVGAVIAPTAPVALNTAVSVHADFTDPGVLDTHTAVIDWGDGTTGSGSVTEANGSGAAAGTHSYAAPGLYTVKVTVTDKDGGVGSSSYQYVVVIDPKGPFVTGGGQVDLPEGPAQFDFVVNYKGQAVPTGNGQFQLTSGKFGFRSSSYDWLIATTGKAVFAGSGTVNGAGDYGYMVSMIDAGSGKKGADALRIKIWDKATGAVVYDTQQGAADMADPTLLLSGGNLTIHK